MKRQNPIPHDAFFKSLLSDLGRARSFLQALLPDELSAQLDFASLKPEERSYIRDDLRPLFSDALFRLNLRGDTNEQAIVSILLEHKSYPDPRTAVQMLSYLAEGYRQQAHESKVSGTISLYPIIPFLFHHGKEGWVFEPFHHLFAASYTKLMHYVPDFSTVCTDLSAMPESDILALEEAWLRAALLTQKFSSHPNALIERFSLIFQTMSQVVEGNFLRSLVVYYLKIVPMNGEEFQTLISQLPSPINPVVMTLYDAIIEQGREKGLEEGRQEGRQEGLERGLEEGNAAQKVEVILKGSSHGVDLDTLSLLTGYSLDKIRQIIQHSSDL